MYIIFNFFYGHKNCEVSYVRKYVAHMARILAIFAQIFFFLFWEFYCLIYKCQPSDYTWNIFWSGLNHHFRQIFLFL